jgi:predicted DNA-binding transcriptional regulator AlpA
MEGFESPLVKVSEVSKSILREQPSATYDKIKRRVFPPGVVVHLGNRSIRFHREKLLAWLAEGGTAATDNESSHEQAYG